MNEITIEVSNATIAFGNNTILQNIHLFAGAGDVVGIVGLNGAGKTSLLKLLCGFILPVEGQVNLHGIVKDRPLFSGILETPHFWKHMTAFENAEYYLGKKYNKREFSFEFERWGLSNFASYQVSKFSLGMSQKLAIILTYLMDSQILLYDEPTNSLDHKSQQQFYNRIKCDQEHGKIQFIVSHDIDALASHSTSLLCIKDKKILPYPRLLEQQLIWYEVTFINEAAAIAANHSITTRSTSLSDDLIKGISHTEINHSTLCFHIPADLIPTLVRELSSFGILSCSVTHRDLWEADVL